MKYQTKIVPQDGGCVGYVLLNNEPVFTTGVHNTRASAGRELESYIESNKDTITKTTPSSTSRSFPSFEPIIPAQTVTSFVSERKTISQVSPQAAQTPASPAPRRCCGRG